VFAAPHSITTTRLTLRRPRAADAAAVFAGWASDGEAARFMSWERHAVIERTEEFLAFADDGWSEYGVGTYFIEHEGALIGSTGLHPERAGVAETGYVLRRDAWGRGFATEACRAMIALGLGLGLVRVQATCHVEHGASARVLEKSGMTFEGVLRRYQVLPNLSPAPVDMRMFAAIAEP